MILEWRTIPDSTTVHVVRNWLRLQGSLLSDEDELWLRSHPNIRKLICAIASTYYGIKAESDIEDEIVAVRLYLWLRAHERNLCETSKAMLVVQMRDFNE